MAEPSLTLLPVGDLSLDEPEPDRFFDCDPVVCLENAS